MEAATTPITLTAQQQRIMTLLFKFRFVTAKLLARVLGIRPDSTYTVLENLAHTGLVIKQYDASFRIDRKPAYYYLSKSGVTYIKNLMGVKEAVVHALYKNDTASDAFIQQSLTVLACYPVIKANLPEGSEIFTKAEINRFKQFPKNRPDFYVRTPAGQEAIIIFMSDSQLFVTRQRVEEILTHYEDEGWHGSYPRIAFVLADARAAHSFLYKTASMLENQGFDEQDVTIVAASLSAVGSGQTRPWISVYNPKRSISLLE